MIIKHLKKQTTKEWQKRKEKTGQGEETSAFTKQKETKKQGETETKGKMEGKCRRVNDAQVLDREYHERQTNDGLQIQQIKEEKERDRQTAERAMRGIQETKQVKSRCLCSSLSLQSYLSGFYKFEVIQWSLFWLNKGRKVRKTGWCATCLQKNQAQQASQSAPGSCPVCWFHMEYQEKWMYKQRDQGCERRQLQYWCEHELVPLGLMKSRRDKTELYERW